MLSTLLSPDGDIAGARTGGSARVPVDGAVPGWGRALQQSREREVRHLALIRWAREVRTGGTECASASQVYTYGLGDSAASGRARARERVPGTCVTRGITRPLPGNVAQGLSPGLCSGALGPRPRAALRCRARFFLFYYYYFSLFFFF